jgi:hypothetical protein
MKLTIVKGKWVDDDVDLLPTIKLRTGSKLFGQEQKIKVVATSIALCWLKWGIMISFGRIINL